MPHSQAGLTAVIWSENLSTSSVLPTSINSLLILYWLLTDSLLTPSESLMNLHFRVEWKLRCGSGRLFHRGAVAGFTFNRCLPHFSSFATLLPDLRQNLSNCLLLRCKNNQIRCWCARKRPQRQNTVLVLFLFIQFQIRHLRKWMNSLTKLKNERNSHMEQGRF